MFTDVLICPIRKEREREIKKDRSMLRPKDISSDI